MDRAQTTGAAGSIAENGLSRFLDGFKAETVRVSNEQREMANAKEGVLFHTIHEKETAITALSWNPNLDRWTVMKAVACSMLIGMGGQRWGPNVRQVLGQWQLGW